MEPLLLFLFRHTSTAGGQGLEGELHLLQIAGITALVLGMIIYQLGKMKTNELLLHLGKALILGSVILNFSPLLQGESSQKTITVALLFGLTGIILSSIIFFQIRPDSEEDEEH
ncbi:MAG: hypothetical protein ACK40M_14195 [Flavobacteriales bacterium]